MANDWIKMRTNLWDDPRVTGLCDATDQPEAMIVGALYWLWATADTHSPDGFLPGISAKSLDRKTGVKGIGEALLSIGWITETIDGITIVGFKEHNGRSAKKRCQTAVRVSKTRNGNADETTDDQCDNADVTPDDSACNAVSVTKPLQVRDLEQEQEREQEQKKEQKQEHLPQAASGKPTRKPKSTARPDDWKPSDRHMTFAAANGLSLQTEKTKFFDYHDSKASRFANWDAAFSTWLTNAVAFAGKAKVRPHTGFDNVDYTMGVSADGRF